METGKFTLYSDTHRKAVVLFAIFLFSLGIVGMMAASGEDPCACGEEPPTLGRFVVTPDTVHFVGVSSGRPLLANRHAVRQCG